MLHKYLIDWAEELKRKRQSLEIMEKQCRDAIIESVQSYSTSNSERKILINLLETGVNNASKED